MQREFDAKGPAPEDVICVIEVRADYSTETWVETEGLTALFRRATGQPSARYIGENYTNHDSWNETMPFDYSAIPQVLEIAQNLREKAKEHDWPPSPHHNIPYTSIKAEVWIGKPNQFRPAADGNGLRPVKGPKAPVSIVDGLVGITEETLAAALSPFYTHETHAKNAQGAAQAAEYSVALEENISILRPLRFGK